MRSFDKIMADVDAEIGALREGSEKTAAAGEDVLDLAAQLRTSAQGVGAPVSAGIGRGDGSRRAGAARFVGPVAVFPIGDVPRRAYFRCEQSST